MQKPKCDKIIISFGNDESICRNMGSRDHYLFNTSRLVAYQVKHVSLHPLIKSNGMTFDHVLTVYNITSDNKNRLKPQAVGVMPRMN